MSVRVIRSTIKPECADAAEAGAQRLFAAINRAKPRGVRYASTHLQDRTTYLAVLEVEDGIENPLPSIPEFVEFANELKNWTAAPPEVEMFDVVGSYRLFGESGSH